MSVPATDNPSQVDVSPVLMNDRGITSFSLTNSWPVWIWVKASGVIRQVSNIKTGTFAPAAEGDGTLIPPSPFFGIFSTQYPIWVSAVAVDRPGFPIYQSDGETLRYPDAALVIQYGGGA